MCCLGLRAQSSGAYRYSSAASRSTQPPPRVPCRHICIYHIQTPCCGHANVNLERIGKRAGKACPERAHDRTSNRKHVRLNTYKVILMEPAWWQYIQSKLPMTLGRAFFITFFAVLRFPILSRQPSSSFLLALCFYFAVCQDFFF